MRVHVLMLLLMPTVFSGAASATTPLAAGTWVLRDDLQRDVVFTHIPQRVISLLPSLSESVCELGACDRLVATDRFSNWPARAAALPKVGSLEDASIESMVSLKPDLILVSHSQRITARLSELGVQSFAVQTESYADIARTLALLGRILGTSETAAALTARIDTEVRQITDAAAALRHGAPGPRVYFEVDRGPYAAGPDSFIGEMLARLGARNVVTADLGLYPRINPEYVVRSNPDVIFAPAAEVSHLAERPGWNRIRAVAEKRLCSFTAAVNDTIVRPGPRVAEGMRALGECLSRMAP